MSATETYVTANQLFLVIAIPCLVFIVLLLISAYKLSNRGRKLREAEGVPAGKRTYRSLVDPQAPYRQLAAGELFPGLSVGLFAPGAPDMFVQTKAVESGQVIFEDTHNNIEVVLIRDEDTLRDEFGLEITVKGRAPYFGDRGLEKL